MNEQDEDKAVFKKAMASVRPLGQQRTSNPATSSITKKIKPKSSTTKKTVHHRLPEKTKRPDVIKPQPYLPDVGPEEILSYRDASVNALMWRWFRQGQLKIERSLDLHGLTLIEAEAALESLMQYAHEYHMTHICIVHGKGSHDNHTPPVLKNWLWRWLRNYAHTLALHSAPASLGGTGALLVWLKKNPIKRKC